MALVTAVVAELVGGAVRVSLEYDSGTNIISGMTLVTTITMRLIIMKVSNVLLDQVFEPGSYRRNFVGAQRINHLSDVFSIQASAG